MTKSIFYTSQPILSYKRLYNMVLGTRGKGKSVQMVRNCISKGIQKKKVSFVVICRYKEDYLAIKDNWWDIVQDEESNCNYYPVSEYKFSTRKKIIYCKQGEKEYPIGEFVILREYVRAKKVPRPNVEIIFFDEFLNEDNDYLNEEITKFLNVCDSIIRNRDNVRVFLVSNTISMLNPYFYYFNITKLTGRFTKGDHNSIVELCEDAGFLEYRMKTKFGSSIQGTTYGEFALQGRFMLDDMTNVLPNPKGNYIYLYNIILNGHNISVYNVNNLLYFAKCNDFTRRSYTPYVEDAKKCGARFCEKSFRYFEHINDYFMKDKVMFETLPIKNEIIYFIRWKMGTSYESKQR